MEIGSESCSKICSEMYPEIRLEIRRESPEIGTHSRRTRAPIAPTPPLYTPTTASVKRPQKSEYWIQILAGGALRYYKEAFDAGRAAGDWIWVGGARWRAARHAFSSTRSGRTTTRGVRWVRKRGVLFCLHRKYT